ncbi:glutaredoxin family protein [uncultured Shewanella sp.]|uniref:glutaredoxin family protein n=1 Tax=uncultured Shewanella sp. TaxID=173975 RepID=UPI00260EBDC9|nr:glutaredoxin family protein [uncultured Shewanella sp.]
MQSNNIDYDYVLYGTEGCHLCELAEALVIEFHLNVLHKDICDDDTLAKQYGVSIPVLKQVKTDQEIAWPFTQVEIQELIRGVV